MKMLNWIVIFLLLMVNVGFAATLDELQEMAVSNRKVVEKYKVNLEKGEKDIAIARSGFLPALDLSYTATQLDEATLFENEENSVAYGAVTWNLFAGFRDTYGVKSAKLLRNAENHKLNGIKQDIQLNVALRYLTIFDRKAGLQVATDFYNTLQKVYTDTESRYKVGLINKNELLKIKVDLDNAKISLKKAQADLKKSVQLLQREIDARVEREQLKFNEFDKLPTLAEHNEVEKKMFNQRSEIKVLEEILDAAHAGVNAQRGGLWPRVDLSSSYSKYETDFVIGNGLEYDEEVRSQVTLSINLFDGLATSSKIRKAKLDARAAKYDLVELKQDLQTELTNLFLDYEVSKSNVAVAKNSIQQAEENLRISELSYQEGLTTTSDLLDAITNLSRAKYNHVAAKSQLFANYFQITRTVDGF